jgi:hypothetical protein
MSDLRDAIVYQLTELRDELRNAQLTDSGRISTTAQVHVETIRTLIEPTPDQSAALGSLVVAFDRIHEAVRRIGPDPTHAQIRKAFEAARQSIDTAEAALTTLKPSEKAIELGL